MILRQIAAPDLTPLAIGGASLQLLDGLGFSEDGATLLVRATWLDDADTTNALHYGVWSYDLLTQHYTACLNTLLAGAGGSASDIDVRSAAIAGSGSQVTLVTQSVSRSQPDDIRLGLINNGLLVDSNLLASALSQAVQPVIERFALSNDGRFVAVQTSSPMLAPDNAPDTNDTSDIYLIDQVSMEIRRVSYVGGSEVNQPVYLGNVFSNGATVEVSFTTDAAFVTTKIDQNSLPGATTTPGAQSDAYLWSSTFDASALVGAGAFRLLSFSADGHASGFVESESALQTTSGGAFFSSSASNIVSNDTNAAIDPFLALPSQYPGRIALNGISELAQGATMLGTSSAGRYVALLSASPEVAGSSEIQQMVVTDLQNGSWHLASMTSGSLANDMIIGGVLSPNGFVVAFTTAADNLDSNPLNAPYGLFVATTGFGDNIPLTVSSFSPADAAVDVSIGSNIALTFSAPVQVSSGTIAIHSGSPNGAIVESYDVASSANIAISGAKLTINPSSDLAHGAHYFVTLTNGVVSDLSGNSYSGTDTYDFTTLAAAPVLHDLTGGVTFWKTGAPIAGVTSTIAATPAATIASDSMTTALDGLYQYLGMADGSYTLTSAKVSGSAESTAIKANDALAALKIAVGMNPNADGSAVSPYQYLAADVNHDGQIKAADALNILKMAVKLDTAPAKEWLFVPESVGSESMSRTNVVWPDNPIPVTLDMDQELNLIGIVKGDVNGSWVA
jgi:hypothetical protein